MVYASETDVEGIIGEAITADSTLCTSDQCTTLIASASEKINLFLLRTTDHTNALVALVAKRVCAELVVQGILNYRRFRDANLQTEATQAMAVSPKLTLEHKQMLTNAIASVGTIDSTVYCGGNYSMITGEEIY